MQNDKIAKAKAGLILDQPFFASILLSMPLIEDKTVPTFGTDGDTIYYNPDFLASLSLQEVTFTLAHEVLHCVFQHMMRRETRNHNRWNIAADYVINDLLQKEKIGVMPQGGLIDSRLVAKGNGTAEGVYSLLPDETEQKGPGEQGGAMDKVMDAGIDEATINQKSAEMKVRVIQAQNAAKMCGKMSAGMERLVKELTKTQTDWRTLLRRFLSERAKIDLSFAKPKRRFLAEDIYLPSLTGEKLGCVAVAVDCSGSINERVLSAFESEIRGIFEDTNPAKIKIIYFDSEVLRVQDIEADGEFKLTPIGGGGTAFSPIFDLLAKEMEAPTACVVLTDLECNDFGPAPSYPVLWASTEENSHAPFGEVITLKGDF